MAQSFKVKDKVCLVTGANRGIGKAITKGLVEAGASKVYATARSLEAAQALVSEFGDVIAPLQLDVTDEKTISAAIEVARDVEVVINNAGVLRSSSPLDDKAIEDLAFEIDVNVNGLLRIARSFAPILKANGGGALVQLNSVASYLSFPDFSTYCASKAAAYSLTQALRKKLAEQNTLVVSVHPGPIQSDMADDAGLGEIAEPPALVSDAIIAALASGKFHAYPDTMAKDIGGAYKSFAENVIEAEVTEDS